MKKQINFYSPKLLLINSVVIFVFSLMLLYFDTVLLIEWELFNMKMIKISFPILVEYKGCLFSFIVLFISFNVLMFSVNYMELDKKNNLFTLIVLMFIMSMNLLIYIPHMGFLLMGWDGLGIISFILVVYYMNNKSLSAGFITAFTNRVGDIFLLMSIGLTMYIGNWLVINMWYKSLTEFKYQVIFILLASMTKSAQLPFSSWLPAAMAAPTPVSALVHSSTLVTAGVFLVLRFYLFLSKSYYFFLFLMLISILTLFMAGFSASMEWDMKKIIALSTLSQLGLMMLMISMMSPQISFIHMMVHAMFKALLFICAGTLIMNYLHSQDLRWMGNISLKLPMSCVGMIVSIMAMCGMPFMSSFYTKDPMLEFSLFYMSFTSLILLSYFSIGITSYYSLRFLMLLIWSMNLSNPFMNFMEKKYSVSSMCFMSLISISISVFLFWLFMSKDMVICMSMKMMTLPMMIMIMGLFLSFILSYYNKKIMYNIQLFNNKMWFIYPLMSQFSLTIFMKYSKLYLENIDQSLLEIYSGEGFFNNLKSLNLYYYYLDFSPMFMVSFMVFLVMSYFMIF
uniref:NADH dehydrogenase subunit 5 n=1 Tax=Haemadipsa yanyuanensis TaxID=2870508 RepID=UPI0023D87186|nr:NADH dehydrogenase subunit 5 [Haemadipsa yanyuanensis]WDA96164.1 NADH dehydrogenase subunit 5 [Haemadipsa yanyuanensis]